MKHELSHTLPQLFSESALYPDAQQVTAKQNLLLLFYINILFHQAFSNNRKETVYAQQVKYTKSHN